MIETKEWKVGDFPWMILFDGNERSPREMKITSKISTLFWAVDRNPNFNVAIVLVKPEDFHPSRRSCLEAMLAEAVAEVKRVEGMMREDAYDCESGVHHWEHVEGSDSLSKCRICGEVSGK